MSNVWQQVLGTNGKGIRQFGSTRSSILYDELPQLPPWSEVEKVLVIPHEVVEKKHVVSSVAPTTALMYSAVLYSLLGAVAAGYNIASTATCFTDDAVLKAYGYSGNQTVQGLIMSTGIWAQMLICFAMACNPNLSGRRSLILLAALSNIIGTFVSVFSPLTSYGFWALALGRFVIGCGDGITFCLVPAYCTEVSPPHVRGRLTSLFCLAISIGMVTGYGAGVNLVPLKNGWRYVLSLSIVWSVPQLLGMLNLPESPRFLLIAAAQAESKVEELFAWRVLCEFRDNNLAFALHEYGQIHKCINRTKWHGEMTILGMLWDPCFRLPLLIGCLLVNLQQLTIQPALMFQLVEVLSGSFGYLHTTARSLSCGLMGTMLVLSALFCSIPMESLGRRTVLLGGICGVVCAQFGLGLAFSAGTDHFFAYEGMSRVWSDTSVVFIAMLVAFFQISFGVLTHITLSEIFPINARQQSVAFVWSVNFFWNGCMVLFLPILYVRVGGAACFWWAGFITAAGGVLLWWVFPENKAELLQRIEQTVKGSSMAYERVDLEDLIFKDPTGDYELYQNDAEQTKMLEEASQKLQVLDDDQSSVSSEESVEGKIDYSSEDTSSVSDCSTASATSSDQEEAEEPEDKWDNYIPFHSRDPRATDFTTPIITTNVCSSPYRSTGDHLDSNGIYPDREIFLLERGIDMGHYHTDRIRKVDKPLVFHYARKDTWIPAIEERKAKLKERKEKKKVLTKQLSFLSLPMEPIRPMIKSASLGALDKLKSFWSGSKHEKGLLQGDHASYGADEESGQLDGEGEKKEAKEEGADAAKEDKKAKPNLENLQRPETDQEKLEREAAEAEAKAQRKEEQRMQNLLKQVAMGKLKVDDKPVNEKLSELEELFKDGDARDVDNYTTKLETVHRRAVGWGVMGALVLCTWIWCANFFGIYYQSTIISEE
ncbi:hypothetical protein CYMTET_47984 [Cymbomonas tetramitiformis]|uniref:Major facilitator superfamily (MFS) profile domain-containing protein n=1 Tax=Cymbomonas tetramitiformis TaxID=36881 RepID=A0AAE0EX70_9CHLO|nr:hypothetical protein CYMTET_47984 [Cymbomonas tetramitiformis]